MSLLMLAVVALFPVLLLALLLVTNGLEGRVVAAPSHTSASPPTSPWWRRTSATAPAAR